MSRTAPPKHLRIRTEDRPFWDVIIAARAAPEWTEFDLAYAAQLARAYADIERLQREIDGEGDVLDSGKRNPKHTIIETLTNRAIRLARILQIHARARNGEVRRLGTRRDVYRTAADAVASGDDLIPTR